MDRFNRYYFFGLSNFLAAFGGGLILGKATNVLSTPYLHGGSILAFFIGTVLGLFFIKKIPKEKTAFFTRFFSLAGGFISFSLYLIFSSFSEHNVLSGIASVVFFLLLSIRFMFWFYSRVKRASLSSGHQQSIALVEFGYYAGTVAGLLIWEKIFPDLSISMALIFDALLQLLAGIGDWISNNSVLPKEESSTDNKLREISQFSKSWALKLSNSIVLLTVGVQVLIFNAAHHLEQINTNILGAFYWGCFFGLF